MRDEVFMERAIELSVLANKCGNEPFGAVLVKDDKIVFESQNAVNSKRNPLCHAELELLNNFVGKTGITDLSEYTLYSSCEPCFMCSGAMARLKVGKLVYGAKYDDLAEILGKSGYSPSKNVFTNTNAKVVVIDGILREKCVKVLENYFGNK